MPAGRPAPRPGRCGRGPPRSSGSTSPSRASMLRSPALPGTQVALDEPDATRRARAATSPAPRRSATRRGGRRRPAASRVGHRQRRLREQHGLARPGGPPPRTSPARSMGLFDTAAQAERVHRLQLPGQPTRRRQARRDAPVRPPGHTGPVSRSSASRAGQFVGAVTGRLREGCWLAGVVGQPSTGFLFNTSVSAPRKARLASRPYSSAVRVMK